MSDSSYILREVLLTLGPGTASLNQKIVLYRGDKGINIRFRLKDTQYRFNNNSFKDNEGNIEVLPIDGEEGKENIPNNGNYIYTNFDGTFAVVSVYKPNGEQFYADEVTVSNDYIDVLVNENFCDELTEKGRHALQIHIFDKNRNRISYEPIDFEVREALINIDLPDVVGSATVENSVIRVATIDTEGKYVEYADISQGYVRTDWVVGDVITADKLNNIESAIELSFVTMNNIEHRIDGLKLTPEVTILGTVEDEMVLSSMVANKNDAYVLDSTRHVYVFDGSKWVNVGPYLVIYGPVGPQGPEGPKGDKGDRGEPLLYKDLTPEEIITLKGPQGEPGPEGPQGPPIDYDDLTPEQLETLRGPQGEQGPVGPMFSFSDLKPEEIEALRGPQGPEGLEGPRGLKGDSVDVIYSKEAPDYNKSALWVVDDEQTIGEIVTSESVNRIEIVEEYPENPEDNVLYIKVGDLL